MEPEASQTTIVHFTRRGRWRWWAMACVGALLTIYGLVILTSPAWARFGIFGHEPFWIWLRGELYLIVGFMQLFVGVGYLWLTGRPQRAVVVDREGLTVRRIFGERRLAWRNIREVRNGRSSLLLAAGPISLWRLITFDPRLVRLDATVLEAPIDELKRIVAAHYPLQPRKD